MRKSDEMAGVRARILVMVLLLAALTSLPAGAQTAHNDDFVRRDATKLMLGGEPFRYSGPNIEWLGLEGYGPHNPMGPRYPSRFEIDDAFATAAEMGAKVARAQTMGDTVGCGQCVEPELGKFNDAAFQASDYALVAAKRNGILEGPLGVGEVGDGFLQRFGHFEGCLHG